MADDVVEALLDAYRRFRAAKTGYARWRAEHDIETFEYQRTRMMADKPDTNTHGGSFLIDIRGQPGDVRFTCPECGWSVTMRPEGADLWTAHGTIKPTHVKCEGKPLNLVNPPELIRTVLT